MVAEADVKAFEFELQAWRLEVRFAYPVSSLVFKKLIKSIAHPLT